MTINDPKSYHVEDPHPEKDLDKISSLSERATAAYARNKEKHGYGHQNIMGAISMLQGLEYHHNNFLEIIANLKKDITRVKSIRDLKNEAIAYLNRLGQFRAFTRSEFVNSRLKDFKITKITEALRFRDHYSAKRAIDYKKKEESRFYNLDALFNEATLWDKDHLIFQFQDKNGEYFEFDMVSDHPVILKEAYDIIYGVIMHKEEE